MTTILSFDTSGPHCTAALRENGDIVAERYDEMARGQAERLFPLCEEVLAEAGADWKALDAIAVGTGPGNFTGIRIAVSAARGLALSLGVHAIGVTGFTALRGAEFFNDINPMIVSLPSTRRGVDVMLQYFECAKSVGDPVELSLDASSAFKGFPEIAPVLGFKAATVDDMLQNGKGGATPLEFERNQAIRIAAVAALELKTGRAIPRPSPIYIRPADAAPSSDPAPVILP